MKRVAIIGGGLAGVAAAVRLADSGLEPVIIESRKRLGGRATSLVDPRTGRVIDNCQHVLLGCCTNLINLFVRVGALEQIEWHDTLYWTRGGPEGRIDSLKAGILPAPLHLAASFQRMRTFTRQDKRHIARAMWRMIRLGSRGRVQWSDRTFAEFLQECTQPPALIRSFWNTIIVSACNLDVDRVCAAHALHVFQEGFLANRNAHTMGLATRPLAELYAPMIDAVIDAGGDIQMGVSAKAIAFDGRRVTGVVTDGGVVEAAAVVAAVPPDRLEKLVSESLRRADTRLQRLSQFQFSPILGVHLYFDRPIMDVPHLVLVDPPQGVQWLFNKGELKGNDAARSFAIHYIHAVISAADDWMEHEESEIIRRVMVDVHHALPRSVGIDPVEARTIKEKRATFAAVPGVDALRPAASPSIVGGPGVENLFLAGDWTDTGWPATMEGAVRSGYMAAAAIVGDDSAGPVNDLASGPLARMLGLR